MSNFARAVVRHSGLERAAKTGDGWLANPFITVSAVDADAVLPAAAIAGGIAQYTTLTATRTITSDTAVAILAALTQLEDGDMYIFMVSNVDATDKVTLAGGVGVTASGSLDVLTGTSRFFAIRRTSSVLVDMIGL